MADFSVLVTISVETLHISGLSSIYLLSQNFEITPFAMSSHSSIFFVWNRFSRFHWKQKHLSGLFTSWEQSFVLLHGLLSCNLHLCPVPLLPFFHTSYVYCLASYIYVLFIVENGRRDCAIVWLHVSDSWKMK